MAEGAEGALRSVGIMEIRGFVGTKDLARIDFLPALTINEMKIAGVDKNSGALAHDEHRISPVNSIAE